MKTTLLLILAIAAVALSSCDNDQFGFDNLDQELTLKSGNTDIDPEFTSDSTSLTADEAAGLILMREEEKMAQDVYTFFFDLYGQKIFEQIAKSEAQHTETVGELMAYFALEDPYTSEAGVYQSEEIQGLYSDLTAAGSASLEEALKTGALIEEVDIADLQELLSATTNADLLLVYGNLLAGSENHLRAFTRNLSVLGIDYEAQVLSADYIAEILAAQTNGNFGNAEGGKNGQGNGQQGNGDKVDADGDGFCDITGEPMNSGDGQGDGNKGNGNKGNGNQQGSGEGSGEGIDADGDGFCDVTGEPVGTQGDGNGQGTNGNNGNKGEGNNQDNQGNGVGIDADGDGFCDVTGEPVGTQGAGTGEGNGEYIDEDGDGFCDVTGEPIGEGTGNANAGSGNAGNGNQNGK